MSSCTRRRATRKYERAALKYERAALMYLARYLAEENPSLADVAQVAALLAERHLLTRGL